MIRGYFDESWKDHRVYAIGGYVGRDRNWEAVSRQWRNRRLRDNVQCFHAADCEDGRVEFKHLSKEERTKLKADRIQILNDSPDLGGFGTAVIIEDFRRVREASERAKKVLGPNPYFLCFQTLLSDVCSELERAGARPGMRVSYIFEEQKEFSGRAKKLFGQFKKTNPTYASRMGALAYASKGRFVPLEIADNLAYETMKEILNHKYDPTRSRRIAMEKMKPMIRRISLWTEPELQSLVKIGRTSGDLNR